VLEPLRQPATGLDPICEPDHRQYLRSIDPA